MRTFFLIISFCIFFVAPIEAEEKGVEVELGVKEFIQSEPRKTVTTAFQVTNRTHTKQEFMSNVELPEGWRLISKNFPFKLGANKSEIKLVSFLIPQNTLAGKYQVTYWVKGEENPSINDSHTLDVVVLPLRKLIVKLMKVPEYVIAGMDYIVTFLVVNESNIENTVSIRVESGNNLPFIVDAEKLQLMSGESKVVTVSVKTDPNLTMSTTTRHRIELTVQAIKDKQVNARAASFVDIIPRITEVEDRYRRLPMEITFKHVTQRYNELKSGFQIEMSGSRILGEEEKRHFNFLFKGPDIHDKSIFDGHDEYFLNYLAEDYELHIGDCIYSLSPLTVNYRYGRGIKGKLNLNNFNLGAFYQKIRWSDPEEEHAAGHIDYLVREKYRIGLNYLKKRALSNDQIVSLNSQLKFTENTDAEFEYALGKNNMGNDNAYMLGANGYQDWISYSLRLIHAGPAYPGYYRNMDLLSASLAFPLKDNLKLNAGLKQEKNNLNLDPTLYSALFTKYYQLGFGYRFKMGTSFSFDWCERSSEDRLEDPKFNYKEETLRFGIGHNFQNFNVYAAVESGQTKDNLNNQTSRVERWEASVYFRPTSKQSFTGYLYYDSDRNFVEENKSYIRAGLTSSLQISSRTHLALNLQASDCRQSHSYGDLNMFEIRLSHTLWNNNRISVFGRHTSHTDSEDGNESALMVEYTVPFGLPVSKKTSIGMVKGCIYDEETKEPISDVILRLNSVNAVTDKNGYFKFPCLAPGVYYLGINTARIGLNRIVAQKTPIEIIVKGGKETFVKLGITKAVSVCGQVVLYRFENNHDKNSVEEESIHNNGNCYIFGQGNNNNGALNNGETKIVKDNGLTSILVELNNGEEIHRRVTDGNGYFSFEEVRPGKWRLKIYGDNLPEHHYCETEVFEFELEPDDKEQVLVKVLPKKRSIRIIQENGTLVEE